MRKNLSKMFFGIAVVAAGIIFLGSAFGYVMFFYFIATWGSTITSLNTYLQPLVGIALGVLVLGERPGWQAWLGIGIVLAGVATGLPQLSAHIAAMLEQHQYQALCALLTQLASEPQGEDA